MSEAERWLDEADHGRMATSDAPRLMRAALARVATLERLEGVADEVEASLRARVATLEAALMPFAEAVDECKAGSQEGYAEDTDDLCALSLTGLQVVHLRAARAALAGGKDV